MTELLRTCDGHRSGAELVQSDNAEEELSFLFGSVGFLLIM